MCFVALTSRDQAVVPVCYTSIDITLPLYFFLLFFLFHYYYYFCCILLPYLVNKNFQNRDLHVSNDAYFRNLNAVTSEKRTTHDRCLQDNTRDRDIHVEIYCTHIFVASALRCR